MKSLKLRPRVKKIRKLLKISSQIRMLLQKISRRRLNNFVRIHSLENQKSLQMKLKRSNLRPVKSRKNSTPKRTSDAAVKKSNNICLLELKFQINFTSTYILLSSG